MRSHFTPASVGKKTMRSHFISGAAIACAVTGATALMPSIGSAQSAYDTATDPTYGSGWLAGQNGGYGFGAWSFNNTDPTPAGLYQGMSSASPLGTAWTLLDQANTTGLANAGRAITGGLQSGQTFETVIENPSGYQFYRGFDILFTGGPDNDAPGDNTAAIRLSVFNYFGNNWSINDTGSQSTPLSASTTAVAGLRLDLALTSATTYSLTMTPLNGAPVYSTSGSFAGPINWVDFREWDTASAGLNDVANNFGIQYMEVVPEPGSVALIGLGLAGLAFLRRRK